MSNDTILYGNNFFSEAFGVLREYEIRQLGERRTRQLVLDARGHLSGKSLA